MGITMKTARWNVENVRMTGFVIKSQEIVQRVANHPTFCPHFAKVYLIEISIFTL